MNKKLTEKDYQRYIKEYNQLFQKIQSDSEELSKRLTALEEKERQRDRDDWEKELALDSGPPDYIPQGDY